MRFLLSVFFGLFLSLSLFSQERTTVLISTSFGDMVVELYNETPQHRDNFVKLVKERFYDGTLFHRIIPNFMIQGGDPDSKGAAPNVQLGNGGPGYTIPAELVDGLFHKKGVLAAARLGDAVNPKRRIFWFAILPSSRAGFYGGKIVVFWTSIWKKIHGKAN